MRLKPINASLLGLCISYAAQAEDKNINQEANPIDNSIEEIQVTGLSRYSATKSDTPVMDTPRSISIVNEQAIVEKGALSLADATAYTAGVTANAFGFATRVDSIKIRGLSAPIYQDSLQALFGSYNNSRLPIYGVEQIEMLKGPTAVLYGSGSAGGILNVITKKPQVESKGEIALEYGTFDHKQLSTDWTGSIDDDGQFLYRFVGLVKDSETQVDYVKDEALYLAPSFTWQPSDATSLTALLSYNKTKGDSAAQFLPIKGTRKAAINGKKIDSNTYLGDPDFNKYNTQSSSITLLGDHQLNDIWNLTGTARYSQGKVDYQQAWASFLPDMDPIPGLPPEMPLIVEDRYLLLKLPTGKSLYKDGLMPRTFYKADSTSKQWSVDLRSSAVFELGSAVQKIILGVQHQDVTLDKKGYNAIAFGQETLNETTWVNVFNPQYGNVPSQAELMAYSEFENSQTRSTSLYVTEQTTINNLLINLGIRYDHVESKTLSRTVLGGETNQPKQNDDALSLSAGAMYQFDMGLSPYISYADSFEAVVGIDKVTGKALKPKESRQFETGIKYQPNGYAGFVTTSFFHIDQKNLANPNQLAGANMQLGEGEIYGMEAEAFFPVGDFEINASYTRLHTKDQNGHAFASVSKNTANTWLSYHPSNFLEGLKTGFGVRFNGVSQNGQDSLKTPSHTLMDAMVGYENDRIDVALNVNNLADKTYISTCLARGDCFYGTERTAILRVAAKF